MGTGSFSLPPQKKHGNTTWNPHTLWSIWWAAVQPLRSWEFALSRLCLFDFGQLCPGWSRVKTAYGWSILEPRVYRELSEVVFYFYFFLGVKWWIMERDVLLVLLLFPFLTGWWWSRTQIWNMIYMFKMNCTWERCLRRGLLVPCGV